MPVQALVMGLVRSDYGGGIDYLLHVARPARPRGAAAVEDTQRRPFVPFTVHGGGEDGQVSRLAALGPVESRSCERR